MLICNPSAWVVEDDFEKILKRIEWAGRKCYKSEGKIEDGKYNPEFVNSLIKRGHLSVIEHSFLTVSFIVDRGISHELVRHRLAAFSQESTRYCNYAGDRFGNEITVIPPFFFFDDDGEATENLAIWQAACEASQSCYLALIAGGASAQEARDVLPNSLKTEIVVTANWREWRHIFSQRCGAPAHPQMKQVMIPLLFKIKQMIPGIFDDIEYDEKFAEKYAQYFADVYSIDLNTLMAQLL